MKEIKNYGLVFLKEKDKRAYILGGGNVPKVILRPNRDWSDIPDKELQNRFLMESSSKIHADWILLDYELVIEVNGAQHYNPVHFGGVDFDEAEENYQDQMFIDRKKRLCIKEINWKLLEFKLLNADKFFDDSFKTAVYNKLSL